MEVNGVQVEPSIDDPGVDGHHLDVTDGSNLNTTIKNSPTYEEAMIRNHVVTIRPAEIDLIGWECNEKCSCEKE